MLRPVYTEPENCQDCYKCIRECPVKAIMVEDNKASIIEDRCIYCGHCTQICPTGAKKVRDGLTRAKYILDKYPGKVYLSLAPSYVSELGAMPLSGLIASLRKLGFAGVSETALGAEIVSAATDKLIDQSKDNIYISSACPVAVDYIRKYEEAYAPHITPIMSPMLAHAKILHDTYGDDIRIVFAGPCIGKKSESDNFGNLIDVVITFRDLHAWLEAEGFLEAKSSSDPDDRFIPYASRLGALYPIEGGMLSSMHEAQKPLHHMAFSGLEAIRDVLSGLNTIPSDRRVFLELLACSGGCVNGPAKLNSTSTALKRCEVIERCATGDPCHDFNHLDLHTTFCADPKHSKISYQESEIKEALASVGKTTLQDELNCSCCGYDSCRDFAIAMLQGRAEENMCASYMRKVAHDKATVLLQKIPAGVILINSNLKVVDMNRTFATYMGDEILATYDILPGMAGASIEKICSFAPLFRTVLATGEELRERRISDNGRTWLLSIYNIQPHRQIFGLLQNLQEPGVRKEWVLEKTREVIRNHMTTVQKVAELLGENAAFTDSTLHSVIAAFERDNDSNTTNQESK